jgi:hypothetical protein
MAAVEGEVQLLRADVGQGRVLSAFAGHEGEPPYGSKLLVKHSLDTARGSPFIDTVHIPG